MKNFEVKKNKLILKSKEFITTRINRIKENKLINKTKIIKKGEYYE